MAELPRDWDAATYDRVGTPQTRWGLAVLDRLELVGNERVIDAGCGTGRVTEALLARLPEGSVVALDYAPSMLVEARKRLGHDPRVSFAEADLGRPLPVSPPVDAVFSTATFHWVENHDALFANLAAVLRPGGQLVAQCGGTGNIASVLAAADAEMGTPGSRPTYFASAEETAARLRTAGFTDITTWLHDEPTPFEPGEPFEAFLSTVCLRAHLAHLPAADQPAFVRAVAARLDSPEIDYVRLNILAKFLGG